MKKLFWQAFRYGLVGASATVFDYGAYYLFTRALGWTVGVANPVSYCAGNLISFLGHRYITFHSTGQPAKEYLKFIVITAGGLVISQLTVVALYQMGIHDLVAKLAAVFTSGLFNFLLNRYWTFRKMA